MDIDYILDRLLHISESNLYATKHFQKRVDQRKNNIHPDINGIYATILNEKPIAISKQDETKFKISYELDNDYDLTIIISIISRNSLTVNLVTSYIEKSIQRRRKDNEKVKIE